VVTASKAAKGVGEGVTVGVGVDAMVAVGIGVGGMGVGRRVSMGGMGVRVGIGVAAGAVWQAVKHTIRVITGTDNILLTFFSFDGYYGTFSLLVAPRVIRRQYTRFRMI
jgi:hypothetical protein